MIHLIDYFNIENMDKLGECDFNKFKISDKGTLKPKIVLRVERDNQIYSYQIGMLESSEVFYKSPVLIFYVLLNNSFVQRDQEKRTIPFVDLCIYNKDYTKKKNLKVKYFGDLNYIGVYLNLLNRYIDAGYDFEKIPTVLLLYDSNTQNDILKKEKPIRLLSAINGLKFTFYLDCRRVIGKDNQYWKEIEIELGSENFYFGRVLDEILNEHRNFCYEFNIESITYDFPKIIIRYDFEYAWTAYTDKVLIENDKKLEQKYRDFFKLFILTYFDAEIDIFERILKREIVNE